MTNKTALVVLVFSLTLSISSLGTVIAATTPSLGMATSYGVLSSTFTNTVAGNTVNGDIGFTTGPAVVPAGVQANYGSVAPYATAGVDQGNALTNLNNQVCTFTFAPGAIDLATDTTHGAIGVYTPGVYCTSGAASIGTAGITLNGSGTYIFKVNGALTSVANSHITLAGASACDVFWAPTQATTLGGNSTFAGTDIDAAGVTLGSNISWSGRALAFGGTVTLAQNDTITTPVCAIATPTPTPTPSATPTPTPTPVATPSATPTPTATPSATPSPILTPTPSPTPTPVPQLPKTGVGPSDSGSSENSVLAIGALVILTSLYLARKSFRFSKINN